MADHHHYALGHGQQLQLGGGGSMEADGRRQLPEAEDGAGGVVKEQDRLLPIANVGRIMKQILPPNAKISKEAKETMQDCVSEFISFVTGEASDKCHKEKRKTVNGDDVCWAFGALGFDDYVDPMRRYLHKYRELEGDRAAAAASSRGAGPQDHHDHPSSSSAGAGAGAGGAGHFMFNAMERTNNNNNSSSSSRHF